MLTSITLASAIEKNKTASTSEWHILLTVYPDPKGNPTLCYRFVAAPDDVTYMGDVYTAFNFMLGVSEQKSGGELPQVTLTVSNVARVVQKAIEPYGGGIGGRVELRIVPAADMLNEPAEYMEFDIQDADCSVETVTFTLGADSPMRASFPKFAFMEARCWHIFNSPEMRANCDPRGVLCSYMGNDTTCERTLSACRLKGNSKRFGGFPGIDVQGFRNASPA
jgi:phage-related protein